jgi:hypothetical protein
LPLPSQYHGFWAFDPSSLQLKQMMKVDGKVTWIPRITVDQKYDAGKLQYLEVKPASV